MRRTILGLYLEPAEDAIETTPFSHGDAVEVEEVQEDLSGLPVYHGQAAYEGTKSVDAPVVDDDGSISTSERTIEDPKLTEWFAAPTASPGFVAIDASDGEYAFRQLARISGGWVEPAIYDLYSFVEYLEQQDARVWQVVWSDSNEAGTWYPDNPGQRDDSITERGLENHPKQIGFEYTYNGRLVRGTIAESGYCEVYAPSSWEHEAMAQFIRDELLQFSGIPDVGPAEDIVSEDVTREDLEDDTDDDQTTLDTATDDEEDVEECEECGREPERGLEEGPDGRDLCPVCNDKAEEDFEDEVAAKLDELESVEVQRDAVADGGETDE